MSSTPPDQSSSSLSPTAPPPPASPRHRRREMLSFHRDIIRQLFRQRNALLVMGKGLGMQTHVIPHFLRTMCIDGRQLVFVINADSMQEVHFYHDLVNQLVANWAGHSHSSTAKTTTIPAVPTVPTTTTTTTTTTEAGEQTTGIKTCENKTAGVVKNTSWNNTSSNDNDKAKKKHVAPPSLCRIITTDFSPTERNDIYMQGGVMFVTSRILAVDLLNENAPMDRVTGIVVLNAHTVKETCNESFIVNLFRKANCGTQSFVKGFSDEACDFTRGFAKVEKVMKLLFVDHLLLWPRFKGEIDEELGQTQLELIEDHISLTTSMQRIQNAIVSILQSTLNEVVQINKSNLDLSQDFTLQNALLFRSFDRIIKHQLDPIWHRVGSKTREYIQDLRTLRRMLLFLTRYDCVTFYRLVESLRRREESASLRAAFNIIPANWVLTDHAPDIFDFAKARVYRVRSVRSPNKRQRTMTQMVRESTSRDTGNVLNRPEECNAEQGEMEITDDGRPGRKRDMQTDIDVELVLEESPKWGFVAKYLEEIDSIVQMHENYSVVNEKVLIMVNDENTCHELSRYLSMGGRAMLVNVMKRTILNRASETHANSSSSSSSNINNSNSSSTTNNNAISNSNKKAPPPLPQQTVTRLSRKAAARGENASTTSVLYRGHRANGKRRTRTLNSNTITSGDGHSNGKNPLDMEYSALRHKVRMLELRQQSHAAAKEMKRLEELRKANQVSLTQIAHDSATSITSSEHLPCNQTSTKQESDAERFERFFEVIKPNSVLYFESNDDSENDKTDLESETMDHAKLQQQQQQQPRALQIIIRTFRDSITVLDEIEPSFVILYDFNIEFIRTIEVYKALRRGTPLRVYFMVYRDSAEHQQYNTILTQERDAFNMLIRQKASLVIPSIEVLLSETLSYERQMSQQVYDPLVPAKVLSTRNMRDRSDMNAGQGETNSRRIIVDTREFRSSLPPLLNQRGFRLKPVQLSIGDYIITRDVCVERKSTSDLQQSLTGGRLFTQAENMLKYYDTSVLLVQFEERQPFDLLTCLGEGLTSDINYLDTMSKLILTAIHFPRLRIVWSRSPQMTAELFKLLGKDREEPDPSIAAMYGSGNGESEESDAVHQAVEMLRRLPGVNDFNIHKIRKRVRSLYELSQLTLEELVEIMGSEENARALYGFMTADANEFI